MIPRTIYKEEHLLFKQALEDYVRTQIIPNNPAWEKAKMMPREAWTGAGSMGFLAIQVPEEYGGMGINDFRYNAILAEVYGQAGMIGPAIGFQVHSDIVLPYFLHYGSEEVKQRWLPGFASGEVIGAICMSEPGAGSDLKGLRTVAVDKGDHYLITGSKTFISNGYTCDVAVVAAKTNPELGAKGISLFAVDMHSPGVTKNKPFEKVGMHAQDTCEIFFENVVVPKGNLLGEENQGFIYMMTLLPQERISVGLLGIAAAEGCLEETIKYTRERQAFGKSISELQNTRFKLAELATEIAMGRVFMDRLVELHDEGKLDAAMASMAKYSMTELQGRAADICVQLHGGNGYMWEYYVARAYADARAQRIYAGSNEIMKELIARKLFS
ncbi:MAG: acyl-CoA dehydrogenase family protein [Bacteroidia bacterium]